MKTRTLGTNGLDVSAIGFGCMGLNFGYGHGLDRTQSTPFAYVTDHHVPPRLYGGLFAIGVAGIMATNLLNARLVGRFGSLLCARGLVPGHAGRKPGASTAADPIHERDS